MNFPAVFNGLANIEAQPNIPSRFSDTAEDITRTSSSKQRSNGWVMADLHIDGGSCRSRWDERVLTRLCGLWGDEASVSSAYQKGDSSLFFLQGWPLAHLRNLHSTLQCWASPKSSRRCAVFFCSVFSVQSPHRLRHEQHWRTIKGLK